MPAYHIRFGRALHESLVLPITATDYAAAETQAAALLAKAQKTQIDLQTIMRLGGSKNTKTLKLWSLSKGRSQGRG